MPNSQLNAYENMRGVPEGRQLEQQQRRDGVVAPRRPQRHAPQLLVVRSLDDPGRDLGAEDEAQFRQDVLHMSLRGAG